MTIEKSGFDAARDYAVNWTFDTTGHESEFELGCRQGVRTFIDQIEAEQSDIWITRDSPSDAPALCCRIIEDLYVTTDLQAALLSFKDKDKTSDTDLIALLEEVIQELRAYSQRITPIASQLSAATSQHEACSPALQP